MIDENPRRSDLQRSMTVVKVMFGVFTFAMALLIGGLYVDGRDRDDAISKVQEALDQFEADRIDRSVNACEDRNDIRIRVNRLALLAGGHDMEGHPTPEFLAAPPARQALAGVFLSELIPLQVCTPEAIDLFVVSDRTEGIVVIDGSDSDYSEAVTPP